MHDHAASAEDNEEMFKREATIYSASGPLEYILKSFGLALHPSEDSDPDAQAWALKLERATHGNVREGIIEYDAPPIA